MRVQNCPPCVFFLTDDLRTDRDRRQTFTRTLTYDLQTGSRMKEYPIFMPLGFRDASEEILRQLAIRQGSQNGISFRSDG